MALTFDHAAKLIGVPQLDAQPLLIQSLVNAIREEEASERGIVNDQILDASGKADLGGGVQTGITAALRSTWKLNFAAGAYQAAVDGGNLADGLDRVYNTGSPQVVLRSSAAATIVATGSGVTAQDKTDIAAATISAAIEPNYTLQDILKLQSAILLGKVSGAGSGTEVFRDVNDTVNRVTATVDETGNRTAITLVP